MFKGPPAPPEWFIMPCTYYVVHLRGPNSDVRGAECPRAYLTPCFGETIGLDYESRQETFIYTLRPTIRW